MNIINNTGQTVSLDGRLRFMLGNPNRDGSWFAGWSGGPYIRTDNIWFSSGGVTLAPGETGTYYNLTWQDADSGCGLGGASPLSSSYLPIYNDEGGIAYAGNVLMYTGGRSDVILCQNLSSNIVFTQGQVYDIVLTSVGSGSAPSGGSGSNPVISFGVNITNATGSPVQLDGRLRFMLGNPNQDGSWFAGWSGGPYIRTDNIWFSGSSIVLGAGETRTFSGLTWQDADSGCGLGGASPLSSAYLPIYADDGSIAYAGNVLMYTGGRSDVTLCQNLSQGIVFQNGGVYDIVITSHP